MSGRSARPRLTAVLAAVLTAALGLSGCSGAVGRVPQSGDPTATSGPATPGVGSPDRERGGAPQDGTVDAARRAAGIADCPSPDAPAVSQGLPSVVLDCLGGASRTDLAGLRGPAVINLWAQWCGPCRAEAPMLAEVARQAQGRVEFVGIAYDDPRADYAVEFARVAGWRYPQFVDPQRRLQGPLGVAGLPMTVFVDAEGRIVHRHPGPFASAEELRSSIDTQLGIGLP